MSEVVIRVENLYKEYRLGVLSHRTLYRDIQSRWSKLRGKEDPNTSLSHSQLTHNGKDKFLALNDLSFDVNKGEVLGVIGRNGAGKSTLLKVLSRITSPTKGEVKIKGRIASLLEVGTGFHPELTGRENIYLNGAILGMSKQEINSKIDEIIFFSEIENFIDTPVKRYSSGMYVRLAFAVAAHLEPEILIVDEVLAVGDAAFQNKCIGKIKDVSTHGRTILFVSHNMTAITSLCTKCIFLKNGKLLSSGDSETVITHYLNDSLETASKKTWEANNPGDDFIILKSVRLTDTDHKDLTYVDIDRPFKIEICYDILKGNCAPIPGVTLYTSGNECAFVSFGQHENNLFQPGSYVANILIPGNLLNAGTYYIRVNAHTFIPTKIHFDVNNAIIFEALESLDKRKIDFKEKWHGALRPNLSWDTRKLTY